ncbi:unnamed protein product, partial [Didymodactylos carnosus]
QRIGLITAIINDNNNKKKKYLFTEELRILETIKVKLNKTKFSVPFVYECKHTQQPHLIKFENILGKLAYQIAPDPRPQLTIGT